MRKSIPPAIAIRLAIIGLLLVTLLVFMHGPTLQLVTDAVNWASRKSVPVSADRQNVTALHEAAHVVASVTLHGAGSVHSTKVYVAVPRDAADTLYGQSDVDVTIRPDVRADALGIAVIMYAGASAEEELLKRQSDSSGSDRREATRALMGRYTDDPIAAERGMRALENEKDILDFMDDVRAAQYCAQSVVQTNRNVVRALGEEIMRQPERLGRRQLDEGQLRAFFAAHPVMKPYTVCDF